MRQKTQENNFILKFVRYEAISMPVVYTPPVIPSDFRPGHRFPKSAMPPPPPPVPSIVMPMNELPKQPSVQHDANSRGLLLGDLSFLSHPPPNMSALPPPPPPLPPPSKQAEEIEATKPIAPTPSLEWDVEHERSSHKTPTPTNNARMQFLDAVKNRFIASSDSDQLTERQSIEAALEVKQSLLLNHSSLFCIL
jgi:hypothetical protein